MYRSVFRKSLEEVTRDVSLDQIRDAIEKLFTSKKEKIDEVMKDFLKNVNFWGLFKQHPLVKKTIDFGNASRACGVSPQYKKIRDKLAEILKKQKIEVKDVIEVANLLRELKNVAMGFIEKQASDAKQGLRHIHAPGSAARDEAMNLYFGEKFTQDHLYKLASRLCSSIAFGDNIGIYSEDEGFMKSMRQFVGVYGLGSSFKIENDKLREMRIQEIDLGYPYVVFLKFIAWLRERIDIEEDPEKRNLCFSILNRLQSATINIFFMPPSKEKWCTISIPRLDFFINNWINKEEAKKSINALIDNVSRCINEARRESTRRGEFEKVRNVINLLMNNYETLCRRLIEYGVSDFYALKNMVDIMIDLSVRYGIKLSFKSLTLAA